MKLSKYTNMISLIIISGFLSSCQNDISSDGSQPADSTYSLNESTDSDTAIVSSNYDIDVNLSEAPPNSAFSLTATASQTENTQTASNTQLHFINSNASEFNITYSDNCNNLSIDNPCEITITPKDLNIDNQTIGYYVTSSINGETIQTKPDYFIVKSLTLVNSPITGSDNSNARLKVKNTTDTTVNVDHYKFILNDGSNNLATTDSSGQASTCHGNLESGESCIVQLSTPNLINTDKKNEKAQYIMQNQANGIDAAISNVAIVTPVIEISPSSATIHALQKKTFIIKNTSPVTARNLNITLPELNNVNLVSNTCGENLSGYHQCQVEYQAKIYPSGSGELTISGDNFVSSKVTIGTSTPPILPLPAKLEASVSPTHITTNSNVNKTVTVNVTNNSRYPVSDLQVTINSSIESFDTSKFVLDTTNSTCNSDTTLGIKDSNNACQYVYTYEPGKIRKVSYPDISFEVTANNSSNSAKTTLTINNYPYFYGIQDTQRVHNSLSNHTVNSVSVADNGKVYVGTNAGLSTSDNLSSNQWQQLATADTKFGSQVTSTFIDSNGVIYAGSYNSYRILISDDNGKTWNAFINSPLHATKYPFINPSKIYAFVNPKTNATTIYAGQWGGVMFSKNKGKTWHRCSNSPNFNSIYVNSNGRIYLGTWKDGLYISKDENNCNSGWDMIKTDTYENNNIASNNINKVYIDKNDYIYLGTDQGLSYSTDAGLSWVTVNNTTTGFVGNNVMDIDTDSSGRVYIGTGHYTSDGSYVDNGIGLSVSDNTLTSGEPLTWQQYTNDDIKSLTLDKNGMIYEGTNENGLLVYNNIKSLKPLPNESNPYYTISSDDSSPLNYQVRSLFIDQNQKIYAATMGGGLYTSEDDGISWQRTNADDTNGFNSNNVYSVFVTEPDDTIYLGTDSGLSIYNGDSWSTITTEEGLADNHVQSVFVDGDNIYAGTNNGLSISKNQGSSWTTINSDTDGFTKSNSIQSVFVDGDYIYAGTTNGLSISKNQGSSWTTVSSYTDGFATNHNIISIYVYDHKVYVGTYGGGLSVSEDHGSTWKTYTRKNTKGALSNYIYHIFVDDKGKAYIGTEYGISIANADMTKWSHYGFRKSGTETSSIFVNNQGTIFAGGSFSYSGIFISKMEVSD
ncbi:hypothetical protein L3V86_00455 [Thiotrichales bacterium 19S11-10]|nr:hypothetical protein [Thiotrichales bacterium 19S11-10]